MSNCDMCGSQGKLFRTLIEGTEMTLCKECSKFGKVLDAPRIVIKKESPKIKKEKRLEIIEFIVPDYGVLVKEKRERLGLKQEEFAKKISEKESIINKVESGRFEPSIPLARKLENFLKITLVKQHEEGGSIGAGKDSGPVTIGDVIEIKSKKAK